MHTTNIEPHVSFSVGRSKNMAPGIIPLVMEDKIYSRTEMRELEIDTSDYRFLTEVGDFCAQLVLKAEAREGMLRAFFRFEDGRKIITPIFWWQKAKGLWNFPVGEWLLLHYGCNAKGGIYLMDAEVQR